MPYVRPLLSSKVDGELVRRLENDLRTFIAEALSVSHPFPADEVTIDGAFLDGRGFATGTVRPPQRAQVDVAILIWCNVYPERVEKCDEIAQQILDGVKRFLPPGLTAWVYLPNLGGFAST